MADNYDYRSTKTFLLFTFTTITVLMGQKTSEAQFTNPIFRTNSPDPSILHFRNYYYLCLATPYNALTIFKSKVLTDFRDVENRIIFQAPPGYSNVWSAEFHRIGEDLYVYFTMQMEGKNHQMHVIKANNPRDPLGTSWGQPIPLIHNFSMPSLDGTILQHGNGQLYFVWSTGGDTGLFIASMTDPTKVTEPYVNLRRPQKAWECHGICADLAPHFIYSFGVSYLVFSASSTTNPDFCLGLMSVEAGRDPMDPANWWFGDDGCVFSRNDDQEVFGPGSCAFTTSPDDSETWMVYHASSSPKIPSRITRLEKISFAHDGRPIFPRPSGARSVQQIPSGQRSYNNPIIDHDAGDPQIIFIGGFYYCIYTSGRFLVYKSPILTDFRNAEQKEIVPLPPGYEQVWAPEFHLIGGDLYLYFCMVPTGNENYRRMYVMKADDPQDPFGSWGDAVMMMPEFDYISIDGTVLQHANGQLYFVWSTLKATAWGEGTLQLFIADMIDPMTVGSNKKMLRFPKAPWECHKGCGNVGPYFIYNGGVSYMIFSASSTWSIDYCLGIMSIAEDKDPLNVDDWWRGPDGPVFWRNDEEKVFTTGHAAFVQSPDDTETYVIYHATDAASGPRIAFADKIGWDVNNGLPIFPRPHGRNRPQPLPSGQF